MARLSSETIGEEKSERRMLFCQVHTSKACKNKARKQTKSSIDQGLKALLMRKYMHAPLDFVSNLNSYSRKSPDQETPLTNTSCLSTDSALSLLALLEKSSNVISNRIEIDRRVEYESPVLSPWFFLLPCKENSTWLLITNKKNCLCDRGRRLKRIKSDVRREGRGRTWRSYNRVVVRKEANRWWRKHVVKGGGRNENREVLACKMAYSWRRQWFFNQNSVSINDSLNLW